MVDQLLHADANDHRTILMLARLRISLVTLILNGCGSEVQVNSDPEACDPLHPENHGALRLCSHDTVPEGCGHGGRWLQVCEAESTGTWGECLCELFVSGAPCDNLGEVMRCGPIDTPYTPEGEQMCSEDGWTPCLCDGEPCSPF